MSRKASEIAERVRAGLPQPSGDLDDLLLPPAPTLVAVPDADEAGEPDGAGHSAEHAPQEGEGNDGGRGSGGEGGNSHAPAVATAGSDQRGTRRSATAPSTGTGRRTVAPSQRRTAAAGRAELVARLTDGQRGWDVPSVWRARHDVRSIGYDVPGPLALAFAQAKLDVEREAGRRLTNEDLVHPALEALPADPGLVAERLANLGERIRADDDGQRLTAYVAVELKHKLEDLALALHGSQGLRVHKGALWALAVADLLESIGVAVPDTIGPAMQAAAEAAVPAAARG